ncbi:MAG TPA: hypothetical protein VHV26_03915 [Rhizomicrobium sp.]|jgi:hypothetical protein|nr:hypothetical protein [Rhizomicrobium sp.]
MTDKIPCRVGCLRPGALVQEAKSGRSAIVIGEAEGGRSGILLLLPDGRICEKTLAQMEGWEMIRLPGPRLVHVRRKDSAEIAWSAYLPDFDAARTLWRELEGQTPQLFEVDIWPQHIDEKMLLADIGYYQSPTP